MREAETVAACYGGAVQFNAADRQDQNGADERAGKTARIPLRWRIFKTADGRLRRKRRARLRATPDRHLQRWIVTQLIVINSVFPAAADAENARADDLGEPVMDACWIAPVGQRGGQPRSTMSNEPAIRIDTS